MAKETVSWSTAGDAITPETLFKRLKALPAEISSKNGGIVRAIMFQVAKVPELRAKELAPHDTGRLANAIRKRRDRNPQYENANENYQVYVYSGKSRSDPRGAWYWSFVHFKTAKNQNATPFLTMAFEGTKTQMARVFESQFKRKLDLVEKKLARIK